MIPDLVAEGRVIEAQALAEIGMKWTDYTGREAARVSGTSATVNHLARADALYWKWLWEPTQKKLLARVSHYWSGRLGLTLDDAGTLVLISAHRALLRWDEKRAGFATVLRWWARATLSRGRADERSLSGGRAEATSGRDPTRWLIEREPQGSSGPAVERKASKEVPADVALCMMEYVASASPEDRVLLGLLVDGLALREISETLGITIPAAKTRVGILQAEVRAALI